ncbi:MraY family glycosyltransferase [Thalassoporum mexicanum]|uniref:MraY family glycosyltransferase n=1 Tax=Thalassoporum mexicanum TaxID=3457544 RepID=UPI0005A0CEAE
MASFGLSWKVVRLIKNRFAFALLDIPNERSSHKQPTPRGGGLGFVIAFVMVSLAIGFFMVIGERDIALFNLNFPPIDLGVIWLLLLPLVVVGIIDDRFSLASKWRYLVQVTVTISAGVYFGAFPQPWLSDWLGSFFAPIVISIIATVLTIFTMTAIVNFYNFMDGLDGLVAGTTALQLSFLAVYLDQPIWWFLVAAIGGFLVWNWSPAKVFMGDVGSTFLGACVAIALLQEPDVTLAWSSLAIVAPLMGDAMYTVFSRLLRWENILLPHRSHIYQRLQQSGWSHPQVAITYMGFTVAIAGLIFTWGEMGAWLSFAATIGAIIVSELYLHHANSKLIEPPQNLEG